MKSYSGYLFDLDGTVYHGNVPIPSAVRFINTLANKGIIYGFVTNNSTRSPDEVAAKLNQLGINAQPSQVMTSSMATAIYLQKTHPHAAISIIGERGLKEALAGLKQTDVSPDVVVVGLDREVTYKKISVAARQIVDGATFIATNPDRMITTEEGLVAGNGAIAAAIAYASKKEPIYIGKPGAAIIIAAMKMLGLEKKESVLVGDNYETDLCAGMNAQIDTIHVQTGITKNVSLYKEQPTHSIKSLDDWKL
ncbi:TIGR01457 family HAD-type hydrolase [Bacillus sp. JCM 19041]|uniref:TIGR01457 family HAD-type hydrolase n=1 Tax=Bacillus sp. JCM 19041 TaxID=1460637 RepID=UPI0006CFE0BF